MTDHIKKNMIDILIFTELDRLSRNLVDAENIINLILSKNVKVFVVLDNFKLENADDRLIFRFYKNVFLLFYNITF